MSSLVNNTHAEALSPYTRPRDAYGPTQTKTATIRFEQRLRGVLRRLNAAIREAIVEDDIFQLGDRASTLIDDPDEQPYQFRTDPGRRRQFLKWLREQLRTHFLTVVGPEANPYLSRTFETGLRFATQELQQRDVDVDAIDVAKAVEGGRFDAGLQQLFERTFKNVKSVARDIETAVREELVTGFRDGLNPRRMAKNITDRVDKIGKHRATLVARTETIRAHTEGALQRYESVSKQADTTIAVNHVGRLTAKDARVCPFCRAIDDIPFTTEEFRSAAVRWGSSVYRIGIPSHPNGRCAPLPNLNPDTPLKPLSERLPDSIRGKPVSVVAT